MKHYYTQANLILFLRWTVWVNKIEHMKQPLNKDNILCSIILLPPQQNLWAIGGVGRLPSA